MLGMALHALPGTLLNQISYTCSCMFRKINSAFRVRIGARTNGQSMSDLREGEEKRPQHLKMNIFAMEFLQDVANQCTGSAQIVTAKPSWFVRTTMFEPLCGHAAVSLSLFRFSGLSCGTFLRQTCRTTKATYSLGRAHQAKLRHRQLKHATHLHACGPQKKIPGYVATEVA